MNPTCLSQAIVQGVWLLALVKASRRGDEHSSDGVYAVLDVLHFRTPFKKLQGQFSCNEVTKRIDRDKRQQIKQDCENYGSLQVEKMET
jgi:hypothetical protein